MKWMKELFAFILGITISLLAFSLLYLAHRLSRDDLRPRFDLEALKKLVKPKSITQFSFREKVYDELVAVNIFDEVKVVCLVHTHPENHKAKAIHVKNTWGKRCNKLLFFSSAPDDSLEIVVLNITESREALWNKTKESFKHAYENHLSDGDWFMKADDDS